MFGDSISAAYGMDPSDGWVTLLANNLSARQSPYKVVNASVSGETTGGGLARLPKTLEVHKPDILVLELGGNDGLRGYPIGKIESNLVRMIRLATESGARVLLVGMVLPPNYGPRYTAAFEKLFKNVANTTSIAFVPFLLDGVGTDEDLMQKDGIHPKAEAQPLLLNDIWPGIEALMQR